MKHLARWLIVVLVTLAPHHPLQAEKVANLPAPTSYVSDFAGVLDDTTRQRVEDLCTQVDRQAHAQIAVVTIKTLENDQSIEEFAVELEEKWKVGPKNTDRGVLMIFVITPMKGRIEVGYGLEGVLNDAKVGDIGRSMSPAAKQGDYNQAIPLGVQQIAQDIASDAGVTLAPIVHQYHRQQAAPVQISFTQLILGGLGILVVVIILIRTGHIGMLWFLLGSLMGGGGGGGGGRGEGDNEGGGFGGFGGGSSGGGGASGDW